MMKMKRRDSKPKHRRPANLDPLDQDAEKLVDSINRLKHPISVCFFNNKGGVGKTTLVANLAAELSMSMKFKILVVDADPQCNLTQYVLDDADFINRYSDEEEINSIYNIINPLSLGKGYQESLPIISIPNFGFDVIIGDPRLALKEDLLAQDWRDAKSGGVRGIRTTLLFHDLIQKAGNYDFVFFDMGPSLGAINRSILLVVDSFVVPTSIDIFSIWAMRNIGAALKIWRKEFEFGISIAEDPSEINFVKNSRLKLIGYVTQQHKERREGENQRIVEAYEQIRKRLPHEIGESLSAFISSGITEPHLGDIRHLGSLAPKSQSLHTPMITVIQSGSYTTTRKQAREIYRKIATRFLENIDVSYRD